MTLKNNEIELEIPEKHLEERMNIFELSRDEIIKEIKQLSLGYILSLTDDEKEQNINALVLDFLNRDISIFSD